MEGGENVERSGDVGGDKPQGSEGAVDDDEGIHSPETKAKTNERNRNPTSRPEEKAEDESAKLKEARERNLSESVSKNERDGEIDLKETEEYKPTESIAISKEVASIECKTVSDMKDDVERKDNLQKLSSQPESAQIKIPQHKEATISTCEVIKNKEESTIRSTDSSELNVSSQTTSIDDLINFKEAINGETLPTKSQKSEGDELKINKEQHASEQKGELNDDVQRSIVEEGPTSTNHTSEINDEDLDNNQITKIEGESTKNKNVVENDKSDSMRETGLHPDVQSSEKARNTETMKPVGQIKQPPDKSKGKIDEIKITQEKKRETASTSSEIIKPLSHKTDTNSKTMTKSHLRTDIDNKPLKSKSMELNKTDKEASEKKVKQKQIKETTTLASSHRIKSPGRKDTLENSKQKSASTGTLSKSLETKQNQCESQPLTSQEKPIKSKDVHATKGANSRSPAKTLSVKNPSEKVISKNVKSSSDVIEKPAHTVFQGTVSKFEKCDEKIQRSTAEAKKNQERMDRVTAEITATTEAAIKEQFKQLESKLPHESPVQNKPASPKQVSKSPIRKQAQQRQQKPTQQKLQDQKQLLQKQPSPQKQKPARSPTRKQQEQKLQQNKQPLKQQQKQQQIQKELAQPKQHTPQIQTTNLSKQKKQQVEIKPTSQNQQDVSQQDHQQGKQEQPLLEQKTKQQTNKVQQQVLIPKQKPQVKQIKQQDEPERLHQKQDIMQEQNFAYLKESKDQEQKEQCEKPMMQQDKETIEQHNLQQKQREQVEAMAKQLGDQQQEKPQQKEDQPDQIEQKDHTKQQPLQQSEDGDEDGGVCGMQGRSCPIYFGVKSYLHHFYDTTSIKNSPLYEEYIEEDDFEYAVDPIKNRGCRRCCRGFWFRAGLWGGINLILVGVITLLVGYLTPQREMIVGHHNNLEILDRSAIAFNRRLELCRLAGLAVFCCGGLVLLLTLLLSSFLHVGSHNNNNSQCCGDNTYYGYVSTSLVEPFIAAPNQTVPISTGIKIPITEQIKSVQPTLWPDLATVKDGTLVPHLP